MVRLTVLVASILCFCPPLFSLSDTSPVTKFKTRQPNWRMEVIETFPHGNPKTVLFYEPVLGETGEQQPSKRLSYSPERYLYSETDLDSEGIPHGPSIILNAKGSVEAIEFYLKGKLHGPRKSYHSSGIPKSVANFRHGVLEGSVESYHENGKLAEKGVYANNKKTGTFERFYDNGVKSTSYTHENGLLEGEANEWHDNGVLSSVCYYHHGLLSGDKQTAAFHSYYPDRSNKEIQDFRNGMPIGTHIKYFPSGQKTLSSRLLQRT